jgi:photosystem II stability/assembly factor-like uncharacterized protein
MKRIFSSLLILLFVSTLVNAQVSYSWHLKRAGSSLGNPIAFRQSDPNKIFYGSGNKMYISTDKGETFTQWGNNINSASNVKTVLLSAYDMNTMLVAIEGPQSTVKTTDGGLTWVQTGTFNWYFYGVPITVDPSHPDTVYSMDGSVFKRTTDFGSTWTNVSSGNGFGAPCDIEVFPDSPGTIIVGDNGYGIARSTDYGVTWTHVFSTSGEIPIIAVDPNQPGVAWATRWSGGGGFVKSTDYGATWQGLPYFNGKSMWGLSVAPQDPNYVINSEYGGNSYLSHNQGASWYVINNPSSNYALVVVDTFTVFGAFGSGLYKLDSPFYIPVELTGFTAEYSGNNVNLSWTTASETNNRGFEVERKPETGDWAKIAFVNGNGTTSERQSYSYIDVRPGSGTQYYRLKQIDLDGTFKYSSTVEVKGIVPVQFELSQNYPNPFNPSTKIKFAVPTEANVHISLYNSVGQKVADIVNNTYAVGNYEINFNASNLSSGTYFYKINAAGVNGSSFTSVKKMMLLK